MMVGGWMDAQDGLIMIPSFNRPALHRHRRCATASTLKRVLLILPCNHLYKALYKALFIGMRVQAWPTPFFPQSVQSIYELLSIPPTPPFPCQVRLSSNQTRRRQCPAEGPRSGEISYLPTDACESQIYDKADSPSETSSMQCD